MLVAVAAVPVALPKVRGVKLALVEKRSEEVAAVVVEREVRKLVPFKVVIVPRVEKRSVDVALVEVLLVLNRFWRVEEARTMIPVPETLGWIQVEEVAQRESPVENVLGRHVPLIAKHPPVRLMEAVPVVVAPVKVSCPETLRYVLVAAVLEERVNMAAEEKRFVEVALVMLLIAAIKLLVKKLVVVALVEEALVLISCPAKKLVLVPLPRVSVVMFA